MKLLYFRRLLAGLCMCFLLISCETKQEDPQVNIEKWKKEIVQAEEDFSAMAEKEGIPKAFLEYAASDVVVLRNDKLIKGREALKKHYPSLEKDENVQLTWKPDFVDVSASGDLGYTYGKYYYSVKDSLGETQVSEGIFHTVWKRQEDGSWKFVWD